MLFKTGWSPECCASWLINVDWIFWQWWKPPDREDMCAKFSTSVGKAGCWDEMHPKFVVVSICWGWCVCFECSPTPSYTPFLGDDSTIIASDQDSSPAAVVPARQDDVRTIGVCAICILAEVVRNVALRPKPFTRNQGSCKSSSFKLKDHEFVELEMRYRPGCCRRIALWIGKGKSILCSKYSTAQYPHQLYWSLSLLKNQVFGKKRCSPVSEFVKSDSRGCTVGREPRYRALDPRRCCHALRWKRRMEDCYFFKCGGLWGNFKVGFAQSLDLESWAILLLRIPTAFQLQELIGWSCFRFRFGAA